MGQGLILFFVYVFTSNAAYGVCPQTTNRFIKAASNRNVAAQYDAVLERGHSDTLLDCATSAGRRRQWYYKWFQYNTATKLCLTSRCIYVYLSGAVNPGNEFHYIPGRRLLINLEKYVKIHLPKARVPTNLNQRLFDILALEDGQGNLITSCSDVKRVDPSATDGEYWMYPGVLNYLGCPTKVYCHGMASASPREYISLVSNSVGVYPKEQDLGCSGQSVLLNKSVVGITEFSKIRINVQTMEVIRNDFTFATGKFNPFGEAADCFTPHTLPTACRPKGTFHINMTGTGVIINKQVCVQFENN